MFAVFLLLRISQSFLKRFFTNGGDTLLYRMLLPEDFDPAKQYPVMMFLHGAGETGE
jgi:predicted peptidase